MKVSESKIELVWILDVRIQSEGVPWMKSESEWISEGVLNPRWQWLNPTWKSFKMASIIKLSQNEWVKFILCKIDESKMVEFKMSAIIKLSQNEWVKFFYVQMVGTESWQVWVSLRGNTKMAESKMAEFKMAAIIKLGKNEWVWVRLN